MTGTIRVKNTRRTTILLTLAGCAVILSATLTYPFNNDNALYAYMADLALKGHLPYIGSWDQNFPGIIAIHAIQILVSGHSQLAFHIFDVVLQLIGSYLLILVGERLHSLRAGVLAALLCALYYLQQGLWMSGERDTYVSIMLVASMLLSLKHRLPLLVGILCAAMFLFRPTYAPYAIAFGAWYALASNMSAQPLAFRKRPFGRFLIGGSAVLLFVVLLYGPIGGLRDLWDAVILFNAKVYSGEGASFSFWSPIRFYAVSTIAVAIGAWWLWRNERSALYLWSGLFASSVLSLLVLYRHSVYHYHPAMTLFLLMSAIGWIEITDLLSLRWRGLRVAFPFVVVFFFVLQTLRGNTIEHVLVDIAKGRITTLEESYDRYEPSPEFGVRVQTEVGDYLKEHTHPDDVAQMFGPYSYPQYRSGLLTASRFQTLHAITMRGAGDSLQPFQRAWREEYMRDMRKNQPVYFIVCDAPEAFRQYYGGRLGHEILRQDFTELGQWLDSSYTAETKIGAFTLYRRRP